MSELTISEVRELLPLYALGELDQAEQARVEDALRNDPSLEAEARAWREDLGTLLADSTSPEAVDAGTMDRLEKGLMIAIAEPSVADAVKPTSDDDVVVLSARTAPKTESSSSEAVSWMGPLALAASLLAVAIAIWAVGGRASRDQLEQLRNEKTALAQEVTELRQALQRNEQEIDRVSTSLRTFGYPRTEPIVLAGLEEAPEATGAAFYRPSADEALFYAFGLPALDPVSIYQLWYITDDGPVSAGVFDVDVNGEATIQVADLPERSAIALWAVTREPAGGSAQPTGPMLIRG